jgi:hypothetical protein
MFNTYSAAGSKKRETADKKNAKVIFERSLKENLKNLPPLKKS